MVTQPSGLRPGDVLLIGPAASPLFTEPFRLRLLAVLDRPAPDGWCFLDGHVLDGIGRGVRRRTVLVRLGGLARDDQATAIRRDWLANNRGRHFPTG